MSTTENPKKHLDLAGASYLVGRVKSLVEGASETAEKASKNTINVNTVKNATLAQGKAPVKAGEGDSYLYIDEGRDSLLLKYQGNYYVNWEDAESYGTVVFGRGVTPPVDSPDIPERLYLAREDYGRLFYWNDGFSEIANNKIVGLLAAIIKADVLDTYGADDLSIGEQVTQNMSNIKRILDAGVLDGFGTSGNSITAQIQENMDEIEDLKDTLNRILNSNGVQQVIDTFKDMEDFLQGITDTTTLTALLQELEQNILRKAGHQVVPFKYVSSVSDALSTTAQLTGYSIVIEQGTNRIFAKTGNGNYYKYWSMAESYGEVNAEKTQVKPKSGNLYVEETASEGFKIYTAHNGFLQEIFKAKHDTLSQRVKDLEDAEPEAITIEEIDAMFDGYSMSGPEPVAPTN